MTRLAYLFPGQGSQKPGMGQSLAQAYPTSREVFERADRALGRPISELCFGGSEEELALTENTQPAMLTVCFAALEELRTRGLSPVAAAGHSLGEYAAHLAAGTFDFEPALRAVELRGRFMQEAVAVGQGAMAAIIGLDREEVERICGESASGEVVAAANINSPAQIVIAGSAAAVERAVDAAKAAGAKKAVALPVSAPFHCSLMDPAAERLRPVLDQVEFRDPAFPVFANVDAAPVTSASAARAALVRQVSSAVLWQSTMENMIADGIEVFVEIGPGKVLAGLARRIDRRARVLSAGDPEGIETVVKELAR